ncbi:hypothetical protein BT69DRAFT_1330810 [Atractiella rhizophila]|nr:hypothetical protein BT69DRAFT_1330810 [Atractiella rhizophila]
MSQRDIIKLRDGYRIRHLFLLKWNLNLKTITTFHAALSGWRPSSVNDVGYQDGLKVFATLWKELQTSPSLVPEVILRPDGAFTVNEKDQHQEEEEDARLEPDPIDIEAAEIAEILPLKVDGSKKDNKQRKLHSDGSVVAKSTFRGTNEMATEDIGLAVTYSHCRAVVYYFYHSLNGRMFLDISN